MPLADSINPKLNLLDREDRLHLHQAACQILKETGVQVLSQAGRDLLLAAGAVVKGDLIKIPPSLVEWALASAPRSFNLYRRGSDQVALQLDGSQVYFGPGSDTLHYLDPRSGQRREFKLADIADCIRLCDALPEIGFVMSVGVPVDAPSESTYLHQFAAMIRNTTKPVVFVCDGLTDIQAIGKMAAVVAGGMDKLVQHPNILLYSEPTTPLQHSLEATEKLLFCAEHAIPVTHSPAPMMGGTAPVTIPGAVALGMAEMLSGLVMHQLKNPGAPFLFGHGVHHLDMRSMISVYGAPEFQLARVMAAEMGRFYGLPVWGYSGHSDSKVIDGQAAVDMQFSVLVAFLARTNLNHDVGYLESGLTNSPEMMVLANEVIAMNRRFMEGIHLDAGSLAVDVISEVGPGGEFMSHDHTLDHFREFWSPQIFDRNQLDRWEEAGSKDLNARLREATLGYMDEHQPEPLLQEVEKEISDILDRA